jgi:hypothetical protein
MAHSSREPEIWLLAGCGFGVFTFFRGFRIYREYRVLEDTPEVPVRSVAMGLVRVHAKAAGEQQVLSPITRTPSFFYKVVVEKWESGSKGGSWRHYATDADGVNFYLEDATGRVALDARGAEYDLIQTGRREIGGLGQLGLRRLFGSRDDEEARLAASLGAGGQGTLPTDDQLRAYAAQARERRPAAGMGSAASVAAISTWSLSLSGGASGRFRFTESCIQPGHWYDVTGTCGENPSPKDEGDRNLIRKGENEPTFLISWRNPKDVESKMRRRATLYILGGAALTIGCAGVWLAKEGWL